MPTLPSFPRCARFHRRSALLLCLLGALAPTLAFAQAPPNAGTLLQEARPIKPPEASAADTGLTLPPAGADQLPPSAPIAVSRITLKGNTVFDTATLHALVADAEGQTRTLAQLGELAARLTDHYHRHGYPLARAIIPAQRSEDGEIVIEIVEARYGAINLDNQSEVSDRLLGATLAPLQPGQVIDQARLERSLLLLGDIPGIATDAVLKPGAAVGTADLQINTSTDRRLVAQASADNDGSPSVGRERVGAVVNAINLLHQGDVLSLNALTTGHDMNYGRLAYDLLVNGQGTRAGGAWSLLDYSLGHDYAALQAHGTAQVGSLWLRHPLLRSRQANLYLQLQYDHLNLKDRIDAGDLKTDRHLDNGSASLAGDWRDGLLSGGYSAWNLNWTSGRVRFDDAAAKQDDAASAVTQGGFAKLGAAFSRQQGLADQLAANVRVSGQWSNANLDSSQKMIVGGPYSVRAYDVGVVSGDSGVALTAELQRDLGTLWSGQWQAIAFVDSAHVKINHSPWGTGRNSATLSGAGLGINWSGPDHWQARASVAGRLGATPELLQDAPRFRGWIELARSF